MSEFLVFCRAIRSKHEQITDIALFFKERQEQFAQGCSFELSDESNKSLTWHFLKSDKSDSLTVALENEQFLAKERKANERKS